LALSPAAADCTFSQKMQVLEYQNCSSSFRPKVHFLSVNVQRVKLQGCSFWRQVLKAPQKNQKIRKVQKKW
jgi:hypothetical protein